MAEGGAGAPREAILEDFFMMDEEPLVDKTVEEDEIDLYINLTFTSSAYLEENGAKSLVKEPEHAVGDELGEEMVVAAGGEQQPKVEEEKSKDVETEPMAEDLEDDGSLQTEAQFTYDAEEEVAMAEQEDDSTNGEAEEPDDLGDPAVMRAVRGQSTLEKEDSAVLDSRVANNLADFPADYLQQLDSAYGDPNEVFETASKPGMWSPTLRRVPSLSMTEALERASTSHIDLDFLASPGQMSYPDSPGLERSVFRGRTVKPSSQRFMRQQSPVASGSVRSPYPFTPPRRTRRAFGLNQPSGYASPPPFRPVFPNVGSPTWSLTPGLDVPPFSPSTNSLQKFSLPITMTQLHPLHERILTQRQRGQKRIPRMKPQPPETDPYAALMTSIEKDWVIKLQMLQLQSENPHQDDYYYQEYYHKLEHKQAEKGLFGGSKPGIPKLVTPYIQKVETYESVVRIPGSLGQVAVSTCYSPRRAIDAVHHVSPEQAVGNQRLHVLYQIEKMYLRLLAVEDIRRKLDRAAEEQHLHFREKIAYEVDRIFRTLRIKEHNREEETKDEFLQILLVGKGKRLVARLLPQLSEAQAKQVLVAVAQHLHLLIKKDMLDEALPVLYGPLREVIERLTFSELIDILQELMSLQPESVKQSLAMVLGNKFAISLLYLLLSQGERCLSSSLPVKPHNGDFEKWVNTVLLVARELSQVPKASMAEPLHLPSNLLFLFCRYVDKDTVNCLDIKME
uniref:Protein PAT1 homolog 2 isoform X1 n=1 Tax=Pogona vitticeps TaxID=103695 RepID=A0A6J0V9N8_9SAUR